jgi:prophage antirepressor-like protein/Txe/YoeB family toxin of Txe-Axe toxin-antitoxin module
MNTLTKTFENSDIRIADINGEILWNLKDVCASLGMATGSEKQLKKRHGTNYFQLVSFRHPSNFKNRNMLAVNQKGLLRIIWRSNKPKAEIFSDWCAEVVSEVLQTGRYDVREHEEQIQQLQRDLTRTERQLVEQCAEVDRRLFLVIKQAVLEWRRENGYRYTDCAWRLKHFTVCCKRLLGTWYKKGNTPYVDKDYVQNAKQAIKKFYGTCQRNPLKDQPHYEQKKINELFHRDFVTKSARLIYWIKNQEVRELALSTVATNNLAKRVKNGLVQIPSWKGGRFNLPP